MLERLQKIPAFARLASHIPPSQFGRYLVVGFLNTIFGYSTYALFTYLLTPHLPFAYVFAGALSTFLNITFSFLNYKWFVFKTRGNYLREWLRCLVVYSSGILLGALLLPVTVFLIRRATPLNASAPYIAGALLMGLNIIASFVGHKKFSFASSRSLASTGNPDAG
jgi:putative flippase GtrA